MAANKCKFVPQYKCNKKCGLGCLGCKTYNVYCEGLKKGREEKDLPKLKASLFCRTVGRTKAMIDELSKYKDISVVCLPDYNQFNKLKQTVEIIKQFGAFRIVQVQEQWFIMIGDVFVKSPKIPITEEQAVLLMEVL